MLWIFGLPILFTTANLRIVLSNIIIRRKDWDLNEQKNLYRILVAKSLTTIMISFLLIVEFLYIYLGSFSFTFNIILVLFLTIELAFILAAYSTVSILEELVVANCCDRWKTLFLGLY